MSDWTMEVLRILGIYSMDKLKRTDWENVGRYGAKKGREYIGKCGRGFFIFVPYTNAKKVQN